MGNKPISIAIKELRANIVSAINSSDLPPCVLEPVIKDFYNQIERAAENELKQAETAAGTPEEVTNG